MSTPAPALILVVDDDRPALEALSGVLAQEGYQQLLAHGGQEALELLKQAEPDLVLTDLRMRDVDGMKVLEAVRLKSKETPVIVMTAFTSMETAIEAIKNGAYDYLSKPFQLDQLRLVISRALEQVRLLKENRRLRTLVVEQSNRSEVVGRSPEMVEIYKLIARVAPLPTTVLIQGESGSGKEVMARLIHRNSGRKGPFQAVNCGALSEGLLESELFGHVKGSFTGAIANKVGIFEAAQDGTCFLDEISNTSLALQMKLLRVLESHEITRVGSTVSTPVNARLIAATNQPLEGLVKSGHFREDLYYRLKVVTLQMPPLRDRPADIPLLLDHFVRQFASQAGKQIAVHESVYPLLKAHPWPGNVRELSHAVERAIALNSSGMLTPQDFSDQIPSSPAAATSTTRSTPATWMTLAEKEREYIQEALEANHQNVTRTAEVLGIDRRTIYRILQRIPEK